MKPAEKDSKPEIKVKHIVLFKFKPETTRETINFVFKELSALVTEKKIPGIISFSHGPYSSQEGLHRDYTHAFIMNFDSEKARDAYLPHPEHIKVKSIIDPHLEKVLAFDYKKVFDNWAAFHSPKSNTPTAVNNNATVSAENLSQIRSKM